MASQGLSRTPSLGSTSSQIPTPPLSPPPGLQHTNGSITPIDLSQLSSSRATSSSKSTQSLDFYKRQLVSQNHQILTLRSALSLLSSDHTRALLHLSNLSEQLESQRTESAKREEEAEKLLDRSVQYINVYERRCEVVVGELAECRKNLKEGEEREKAAQRMYQQMLDGHQTLVSRHSEVQKKLDDAEKLAQKQAEEAEHSANRLRGLEEDLIRLQGVETDVRKQVQEIEGKAAALEAEKVILGSKLAQSLEAIESIRLDLTQLVESKTHLEERLKASQDLLEKERESLARDRENNETCLRALQNELDETIAALSTAEANLSTERALSGDLKNTLSSSEAKVKDLETRILEVQEEVTRAKETLSKNAEQESQARTALETERDDLLEQRINLEKELMAKIHAVDEANVLISQERKAKESVLSQLEVSEAEIARLKALLMKESSTDSYSYTSTGESISNRSVKSSSRTPGVIIESEDDLKFSSQSSQDFPKGSPSPSVEIDISKTPSPGLEIPKLEFNSVKNPKRARVTSMFHIGKRGADNTPRSRTSSATSAKGLAIPNLPEEPAKPFKTPGLFKRFSTKESKHRSFEITRDGKPSTPTKS